MSDDNRRGRPRPGGRPRPSFDDVGGDDEDRGRGRPGARRPGGAPPRGRAQKRALPRSEGGGFWGLFSSSRAQGRRRVRQEEFDWGAADEDDDTRGARRRGRFDEADRDEESPRYDETYDEYSGESRGARRREKRGERLSLMDLASPIFGYSASLPQDPLGFHPSYPQFRQEVLAALQRIQSEAAENGIDAEDAEDARFALALFMDEQVVATSEWSGKSQWINEPLNMTLLSDPEGGVNFFRKLESFGDRRKAVKEVYLVCLAMGFRGQYAELDPTQQSAKLGEIRQKVIRSIHPQPLDTMDVLFPEAYEPAAPIEDDAPPPPKVWVALSVVAVVLCIGLWVLLYVAAGSLPDDATREMRRLAETSATEVSR